jgi:hypothetical protein
VGSSPTFGTAYWLTTRHVLSAVVKVGGTSDSGRLLKQVVKPLIGQYKTTPIRLDPQSLLGRYVVAHEGDQFVPARRRCGRWRLSEPCRFAHIGTKRRKAPISERGRGVWHSNCSECGHGKSGGSKESHRRLIALGVLFRKKLFCLAFFMRPSNLNVGALFLDLSRGGPAARGSHAKPPCFRLPGNQSRHVRTRCRGWSFLVVARRLQRSLVPCR